ncbi:exo-alpha-sialidase [uncultured Muribaculum sp.]|uniref:sialidase family protein n=1 Tax=uncultured Muribaculum sp. TaxID=1918613 RepID=UPI0025E1F4BB|nr:sialidase family protein [uncultured Muribaculum sp.]
MKPTKYIAMCGLLGLALAGCSDIDPVISDKQLPSGEQSHPFVCGADNYAVYRIPSMVITKHDNVLAFCEGRVEGREDTGNIDIVLRRSGDRGRTWQELLVIYDSGTSTCHNPCPVYIPEMNRVVMVMNRNYGDSRVLVTYSDNEGQTWSAPREITTGLRPAGVKRYTQGPCHGIVKQLEPNKGRLVISGYQTDPADGQYYANSIYSDDNGETWHHGGTVPTPCTNESTVCELSDGSLLMSIRMQSDDPSNRFRGHSISRDGGITWTHAELIPSLPDPGCQGSIYTWSYGGGEQGKNVLVMCNPAWQERRLHNTVRASFDDGATWTKGFDYTGETVGGYSDVAAFSDGEIAVLSEYGYLNEGGIIFRKFKLDDLR